MAELALGNSVFGNAARARQAKREREAAEVPIFVGAMAEDPGRAGPLERHRGVSVARRGLAACDLPPVAVGW